MAKVDLGAHMPGEARLVHQIDCLEKHGALPEGEGVLLVFREMDGDRTAFIVPTEVMPTLIRDMSHGLGKALLLATGGRHAAGVVPFETSSAKVELDPAKASVILSFQTEGLNYTTVITRDLLRTLRDGFDVALNVLDQKPQKDTPSTSH